MNRPKPSNSRDDAVQGRSGTSIVVDLTLAATAYAAFVISQVWLFVFASGVSGVVEMLPCPLVSVDSACVGGLRVASAGQFALASWVAAKAMFYDVALFAAWGGIHSLMAREWFKARWTKIVPVHLERSVYVLVAGLGLSLVLFGWQPIPGPALRSEGWVRAVLVGASLVGWCIATWATFLVDHLALFGIRPVLERHGWLTPRDDSFVQPAVYRWVRHPMMTGVLIILWAMPDITPGRVFFAVIGTAYVFIGTHFEERDLLRRFGQPYVEYRARTGKFFPRARG